MSKKNTIAVVVTYNRCELLQKCLEALSTQDCDVLIVDNASTDGTKERIKKHTKMPQFIYENTGKNLGGAGGFNYGMRRAVELGYDYVWVMDDDCIVGGEALAAFKKTDKKLGGQYGWLSSKVLWKDGRPCLMNIQKTSLAAKISDFEVFQKIQFATFVSLFMKSSTIKKYGLPIKEFFIWGDDMEYTRRISRREKCYYVPDSEVIHETDIQSGSDISRDDENRLWRYEYAYRNESYMFRREGVSGLLYQKLRLRKHLRRIQSSSLSKKEKERRAEIIIRNDRAGKSFNPPIEYVYSKPIRVLQLFGEPIANGGQESAIMNFYRNIDRNEIQFDFFTPFCLENDNLRKEIESLGGKVFAYGGKFNSNLRKMYFARNTKAFLLSHNYDIVHINSGSIYHLAVGAKIARRSGARKVIVHSHAAGLDNLKHKLVKKRYAGYFKKYPTDLLTCSLVAAQYKYPDEIVSSKKYITIKNGVDLKKYSFSQSTRASYRKKLGIGSNKAIFNVGRMSPEKNQAFLLEVMEELMKKGNDYRLFICGEGEMRKDIDDAINNKGLARYVTLLGARDDISELLNAMDVFVLPSLWEGLPVAAVEAQTNGLPTICSDRVTREVKVLDSCAYVDLRDGKKRWADAIINELKNNPSGRIGAARRVGRAGFSAKDAAVELTKVYLA